MIVIAHRGASHDAPENTLAAIGLAWEQQADAVEIDIRLTADRHIVLMHDATAQRTAGADRPVVEMPLAELRALDAGRHKGTQWTGECVPLLDEVLPLIPSGKGLFIEIKCGTEILPRLEETLSSCPLPSGQTVLIGFNRETMQAAKCRFKHLRVLWLCRAKVDGTGPALGELIAAGQSASLDGLDIYADPYIDGEAVRGIRDAGMGCIVWTVDDPDHAIRLRQAGVEGITTNRPGFIREALGRG